MRRQLEELLGFMDGKVSAEKRIAQLLQNEPLLAQVASEAMKNSKRDEGEA
jgi:type VI secretion system protein ImpB